MNLLIKKWKIALAQKADNFCLAFVCFPRYDDFKQRRLSLNFWNYLMAVMRKLQYMIRVQGDGDGVKTVWL